MVDRVSGFSGSPRNLSYPPGSTARPARVLCRTANSPGKPWPGAQGTYPVSRLSASQLPVVPEVPLVPEVVAVSTDEVSSSFSMVDEGSKLNI